MSLMIICYLLGLEVSHVYCRDSEFPDKILPDSFCLDTPKPFPIVRKCYKGVCPPRYLFILY